MAGDAMSEMLGAAAAFFGDLGPSLAQLDPETRHGIVDAPWSELRGAIVQHRDHVKKHGLDRVGGWFGSKNRAGGVDAFSKAFDAAAAPLMARIDATYTASMGGMSR